MHNLVLLCISRAILLCYLTYLILHVKQKLIRSHINLIGCYIWGFH